MLEHSAELVLQQRFDYAWRNPGTWAVPIATVGVVRLCVVPARASRPSPGEQMAAHALALEIEAG